MIKKTLCILFFCSLLFSKGIKAQHYNCFDTTATMIYHGDLTIFKIELTGNLVIKKNNHSYRMAFFNDLGMSFFDAEISTTGSVIFKNIVHPMDNVILKSKMRKLFKTILLPNARKIKSENDSLIVLKNNSYRILQENEYYEHESKNRKYKALIARKSITYPVYFTASYNNDLIRMKFTKTIEENTIE